MKKLFSWLDDRTGYRQLLSEALYENVPGGSRWRYVWGSTLVFVFFVQVVTGLFLWMCYSPSTQTAWESVYYLQYHMDYGWLLRGIHHYAATLMIFLMALHLLQVVIDGAYKAPREFNFWTGLILMQIVLGLALTGYLLPWDQKGYWATKVATEIAGSVGREVPEMAVGGADYGHQTLTRFFALHAGVLPALLMGLLVVHIGVFRRHGITAKLRKRNPRPDQTFWPDQILKDAVACLAVLLAIVFLAWQFRAELGAPADAAENYSAARPEWYFLFLFQFLKYFPGEYGKLIGAVVIPALAVGFMFLMPFIGGNRKGHLLNIAFLVLVLAGAAALTGLALREDYYALLVDKKEFAALEGALDQIAIDLRKNGDESKYQGKTPDKQLAIYFDGDPTQAALMAKDYERLKKYNTSQDFLDAVEQAERNALRVKAMAVELDPETDELVSRIPPTGALTLLRTDPATQGPQLYRRYCASCHDYSPPDASEKIAIVRPLEPKTGDHAPNGAPDLYRFASREWIKGLLDPEQIAKVHIDKETWQVRDAPFFGNTKHAKTSDSMVEFVKGDLADLDEDQQQMLDNIIIALSAEAGLKWQAEQDAAAAKDGTIEAGKEAFTETFSDWACSDCHTWGDIEDADDAPDLTGYGSREWTIRFISDPIHFYGKRGNDRMPAFDPPGKPTDQQLTPEKIGLIVDWLREEWYEPPASYVPDEAESH